MLVTIVLIATYTAVKKVTILVNTTDSICGEVIVMTYYADIFSAAANTICVFIGLAALTLMPPVAKIAAGFTIDTADLIAAVFKIQAEFVRLAQVLSAIVTPGIMPAVAKVVHINVVVPDTPDIHLFAGGTAEAAVLLILVAAAEVVHAAVQLAAIVAGVPALILVMVSMIAMPDDGDHDAVILNTLAASDTGAIVRIAVDHMLPIVCFFAAGTAVIA